MLDTSLIWLPFPIGLEDAKCERFLFRGSFSSFFFKLLKTNFQAFLSLLVYSKFTWENKIWQNILFSIASILICVTHSSSCHDCWLTLNSHKRMVKGNENHTSDICTFLSYLWMTQHFLPFLVLVLVLFLLVSRKGNQFDDAEMSSRPNGLRTTNCVLLLCLLSKAFSIFSPSLYCHFRMFLRVEGLEWLVKREKEEKSRQKEKS